MGRYNKYEHSSHTRTKPDKVHPIWQGIGCLMLIIIPILSYVGAVILVEQNMTQKWLPAPAELMKTVAIPVVDIAVEHLYANLVVALLLALGGFAIMTMLYGVIYGAMGPSRYGPLDAHPDEFRPHKRRR